MKICVFGAASAYIEKSYIDKVEDMGERLARRGHALVFGAGKSGLMGAAARGFKRGGGEIYGVIPKFFRDEDVEPVYDECTELIYTDTMAERKTRMEDLCDAFVIVPGGIGTFEEFFEVLTLKQLGRHAKAMAIYNIDGYYDELEKFMRVAADRNFITKTCAELYASLSDPDEIASYLEGYKPPYEDWKKLKNAH